MMKATCKLLPVILFVLVLNVSSAQADDQRSVTKEPRPYKLLTSGRQITLKSNKNIRHIMIWTLGGNRVAEHKDINASTYSVEIPISQKTFFLMVTFTDGKLYTEKIGIR